MRPEKLEPGWSLLCVLCVLIVQSGCDARNVPKRAKYSATKMLMGTIVRIDVCRDQAGRSQIKNAYEDVWQRLEVISRRMNASDESSDIAKINAAGLEPVFVAPDTYHVLEKSIGFTLSTKGAFDITVSPLMALWRDSERNDAFPAQQEIRKARSSVGSENIQLLGEDQIRLLNAGTKIDLGGIAKGYAVDEAARILRSHGIKSFYIDAGGDIYVGGKNCAGEPWRIGIRDPQDKEKMIDVVTVVDQAVATSGDYEQYYRIQEQQWSHILNPVTGYPQKGVISATVIAPTAMDADALATALCVFGGRLGTDYINTLQGTYASFIVSRIGAGPAQKFESQEYKKFRYNR